MPGIIVRVIPSCPGVSEAERSVEGRNSECGMQNAGCGMRVWIEGSVGEIEFTS
jgi:hypothetical protein